MWVARRTVDWVFRFFCIFYFLVHSNKDWEKKEIKWKFDGIWPETWAHDTRNFNSFYREMSRWCSVWARWTWLKPFFFVLLLLPLFAVVIFTIGCWYFILLAIFNGQFWVARHSNSCQCVTAGGSDHFSSWFNCILYVRKYRWEDFRSEYLDQILFKIC